MAARTVFLTIGDVGVEYEMEVLPGQAMYHTVKKVMRVLSKEVTGGKNRDLFRAKLMHRVTRELLANGSVSASVDELLTWQDEEERAHDAEEQTTIKVVVSNADRDERAPKKQKLCAYNARGNCRFGQACRNPHA